MAVTVFIRYQLDPFRRAMFGEYALYADGKVVALVCGDLFYVKILPASHSLRVTSRAPHAIKESCSAFSHQLSAISVQLSAIPFQPTNQADR